MEADDKTVALNSPGTVQAVQLIADMFNKHKIIPKGTISWDNQGNNKAYQSRQVIFVLNPTSICPPTAESDKELYDVTGLLPVPAGPAGSVQSLGTGEWVLQHNPIQKWPKGWCSTPWSGELAGGDGRRGRALEAGTEICMRLTSGSDRRSSIGA